MARITAWRTTKSDYADTAFSGEGARIYGGRWNPVGVPAVYLSSSRSLSVLEVLAQVRRVSDLADYVLIPATFSDAAVDVVERDRLPTDWRALPAPDSTRRIGEAWAGSGPVALLVPSVILPAESNYVLNPLHPDMGAVEVGRPEPLDIDRRLFKS